MANDDGDDKDDNNKNKNNKMTEMTFTMAVQCRRKLRIQQFCSMQTIESAEERLNKITLSSDIKLLLYLLHYANQAHYESLRDFLSPMFQVM